jgi:SARP family transcriptional regulator, regulator of embCAB operon
MELRVLGVLEIEVTGDRRGPGQLGGRKPKQVLELLAAAGGRPVQKETLIEQLWGDAPPRHPVAALENHVWVLRRHLPDAARAAPVVVATPACYRLAVEHVSLDLARFEELLQAAAGAGPEVAARHLREALSLVRGEVFEDEPYAEWAHGLREVYRTKVGVLRLDLAELALRSGDLGAALAQAQRVVDEDPLNERGVRLLMRAHRQRADRPRALSAFADLQERLRAELGVEPSSETLELHAALRGGFGVASVPSVQRGTCTGTPRPAPGTVEVAPRGPLVGRRAEVAQLVAALREGLAGGGLVLVDGLAHVGKSRVVGEACSRLDGVPSCRIRLPAGSSGLAGLALGFALGSSDPVSDATRSAPRSTMENIARSVIRAAPIVLVVDDVHHGGDDALELLSYLGLRLPGVPAVVVAVCRGEEVPADHPLRTLPYRSHLRVEPLGADALGGDAAQVLLRTGGYGAYVAAWLRGERTGPPAGDLLDAVVARCRAAGPEAYRILLAASAFDGSFSPSRLAAATGIWVQHVAEELDRLTARGLFHELRPDHFVFSCTLVADVLRSQLSRTRRALLRSRLPEGSASSGWEMGSLG